MEYLKRIGLLVLIVGVVFVKVNWYQGYDTILDFHYIVSLLLNCLFVILLIGTYVVSKSITRTSTIVVIEALILVFLFMISIYVPLYNFFEALGKAKPDYIINNQVIIDYGQIIFGGWIFGFLSFSPNRGNRKRKSSGIKKYY